MKRIIWLLMLLLLLTGCAKGAREFNGEIIAFHHVDGDGEVYAFQLLRQDGKEFEIFLREDTDILCWVDTLSREEFLEGNKTGLLVNVEYEKISGMYMAKDVSVNGQRFEKVITLEDGTHIDVVERMFGSRDYCLEDGTVLLYERDRVGPEDMSSAFSYDDLNRKAQESISAYYEAKEPYYDLKELLEQAYSKWYILKNNDREFQPNSVSCDIYPSAINEKLVFYGCEMLLPGETDNASVREGAVFDRETGEWISSFELFTCDQQELLDVLFETLKIEDEVLQKNIRAAMSPEKIIFSEEGLELWFAEEELTEYGSSYGMGISYRDGIGHLMHDWAIPDSEEE